MGATKVREILFKIVDVGGLREAEIRLRAGVVNLLRGRNGVGKTSAILAMLRALGADIGIEVRDGATLGTVEVERFPPLGDAAEDPMAGKGKVVVSKAGRVTSRGDAPPITVSDVSAVTSLITADHRVGTAPRAKARLEAFLRLVRPAVDAAAIEVLTERDEEMGAYLAERAASGKAPDLLTAAGILQEELQRRAREEEASAQSWGGTEAAHLHRATAGHERLKAEFGLFEPLERPDVAAANAEVERLAGDLRDTKTSAEKRAEKEALQERIRSAAVPRPDVDAAYAVVQGKLEAARAARTVVSEREVELARAQERLDAANAALEQVVREGREAEEVHRGVAAQAKEWDSQAAVLSEVVEGKTPADVANVDALLSDARRQADVARLSEEVNAARLEADAAGKQKTRAAQRGEQLRAWSKAIPERIADVLASEGVRGWTIVDGELAYRLGGGDPLPFDTRLSQGQQVAAVFELAAARFNGFVHLAPEFWASLDAENRSIVERWAAEHLECFLVTEEPSPGELEVVHAAALADGGAA